MNPVKRLFTMDNILENLVEDAARINFKDPYFLEGFKSESRKKIMEEIERCRWEIDKNHYFIDECWERLGEIYD